MLNKISLSALISKVWFSYQADLLFTSALFWDFRKTFYEINLKNLNLRMGVNLHSPHIPGAEILNQSFKLFVFSSQLIVLSKIVLCWFWIYFNAIPKKLWRDHKVPSDNLITITVFSKVFPEWYLCLIYLRFLFYFWHFILEFGLTMRFSITYKFHFIDKRNLFH